MLRTLVALSLQFRFLVLAAALALVVIGASQLDRVRVAALPELTGPIVEIQTEALGLSAAEVEDLVTVNVEELLAGTAWLKTMRSKSVSGLSSVLLIFEPGTDVLKARQMVQERLSTAYALPNVSKPPVMLQPLSTANRAMMIAMSSKDVPLIDMSVIARWTMTPKLLAVPGVANVAVWGLRSRQLQVQVDPERLRESGVTLKQVIQSAGDSLWVSPLTFLEASTLGPGGWIDTPNQRLGIQHVQPISLPGDLAEVAVAGSSLRLGEVASVVEEHPPLIGDAIVKGAPGLLLVIEQFPDTNALEIVEGVDRAVAELRQGLPGIDIDASVFRETSFVTAALGNIGKAALASAILLILVLAAGFGSARGVLVGALSLGLSLLAAALVLHFLGRVFNLMILAGLAAALGCVIDDAIVGVDNVMGRLRREGSADAGRSRASLIAEACCRSLTPIGFASVILLLVVAPVAQLAGATGALVSPLTFAYVVAVLASLAVSLTALPVLSQLLLVRSTAGERRSPPVEWVRKLASRLLPRAVAAPRPTLLIATAVAAGALALVPAMTVSLDPQLKERDLLISWESPPGTSHPEMLRIVTRAGEEVRRIPGVVRVASHVGRAITGDQIVGIESARTWVGIDEAADYEATVAAVRDLIDDYPGLDGRVETYLGAEANEALQVAKEPIAVRLEGPEFDLLQREAEKLGESLSRIAGIANLRVKSVPEAPQVEVRVDIAKAARVGLTPGDVRRAAATVFAGLEVGNLFEQQKVFEVVVWGAPEARRSLSDVRELLIDTPGGGHVRLADVAEVKIAPTQQVIEREGVSRHVDILADVAGRNLDDVTEEVRTTLAKTAFPFEYHAVLLGEYEEWQAVRWRTLIAAIAVAIGIYFLLQAFFQSWRLATAFYLSLVAALAGSVAATAIAGGAISLGALAGLLVVLAFAVRTGLVLIDDYRRSEAEEGGAAPRHRLVIEATLQRVRPVLTTAAAIVFALLPLLVMGNVAGLEIVHPLAVAAVGGLATAVPVGLLVVPVLYVSFARPRGAADEFEGERHALA